MSENENPVGLRGMDFIEYASPEPERLEQLFFKLGLKKVGEHKSKKVSLYRQNDVSFILNLEDPFADSFKDMHGPSICATGFRVKNAEQAKRVAIERGARPAEGGEHSFPAIYGIGDSIVYFVEGDDSEHFKRDFNITGDMSSKSLGLEIIDHMTNNVPKGEMQQWCDFYEKVFNFKEKRYFDIKGKATGLVSKVMRSPCNRITIPINEPTDGKSQIQEYIDEYKGSGIQHIAFLTNDIIKTVTSLRESGIQFLETPDTYYEQLLERLPNVEEDLDQLRHLKILVDGDEKGYLLQIFTKNMIGPIFFEIIQRKNHDGFGEGNFQALFDAIEADQRLRGYL